MVRIDSMGIRWHISYYSESKIVSPKVRKTWSNYVFCKKMLRCGFFHKSVYYGRVIEQPFSWQLVLEKPPLKKIWSKYILYFVFVCLVTYYLTKHTFPPFLIFISFSLTLPFSVSLSLSLSLCLSVSLSHTQLAQHKSLCFEVCLPVTLPGRYFTIFCGIFQ